MRTLKKNKGYTLIELITVIVVLAIIGGFTFSFIDNAIRTYVLAREQSVVYYEGTYIMERIVRELSDAAEVPVAGIDIVTFKKLHPSEETVIFEKKDAKLLRNGIPIGDNIDKFNVTKKDNGTITVELEFKDASIFFELRTGVAPNNARSRFDKDYHETIE